MAFEAIKRVEKSTSFIKCSYELKQGVIELHIYDIRTTDEDE